MEFGWFIQCFVFSRIDSTFKNKQYRIVKMILKKSKHTIKIMLQKMITSRNSKKYTNVLDHVPLVSDLKHNKWPQNYTSGPMVPLNDSNNDWTINESSNSSKIHSQKLWKNSTVSTLKICLCYTIQLIVSLPTNFVWEIIVIV